MILNEADLTALWITLKLATLTTLILLALGTPLAWWIARMLNVMEHLVAPIVFAALLLRWNSNALMVWTMTRTGISIVLIPTAMA